MTSRQQTALVWTLASFYLGVVALLTVQALRAQPLLRPDTLQLGLLGGLVAAAGVAILVTLKWARRPVTTYDL